MTTTLLIVLLACRDPAPEAASLASASTTVTFGSVEQLGSFVLEARIQRDRTVEGGAPRTSVEAFRLRWKDRDHFEVVETRDGAPSSHTLVLGGKAFYATGRGQLRPQKDAEPHRVQLAHTWDPWTAALGPWADHVRYTPAERGTAAGRPAVRYELALAEADPKKRGSGWQPTALSGQVWVDEATSVRLMADVRAEARSGGTTQTVQLQMTMADVGVDLAFTPPPAVEPIAPIAGAPPGR